MNLATNGGADEESHFPSQVEQDVDSHQNYLFGLQGGRNHLKQNTYMKNSESGHFMSSVPPSAILSVKGKYTIFPIFFYHMFYTQISCQNVLV
jgi:pumilio RNA-binding family